MKLNFSIFFLTAAGFMLGILPLQAQTAPQRISLPQVETWAEQHFPLLVQKSLATQQAELTKNNLGKGYLPQVNLLAQATWQNAVPEIPIESPMPGLQIDPVSKDQYRALLDVAQLIYDGGAIRHQQQLADLQALIRSLQSDSQFEPVRERIAQLYFNALLANEQRNLLNTAAEDIANGIGKVQAQVDNGTAFRSQLATLQTEQLKIRQQQTELDIQRETLMEMLALFTGQPLDTSVMLEDAAPQRVELLSTTLENRPEWKMLAAQDSLSQLQSRLADIKTRPRLSAFVQGGYGNPGFNMLKNEFAPMLMTGLRLNWNLSAFYTRKNDFQLAEIQQRDIAAQKENFELQTRARLQDEAGKMARLESLLRTDDEIIALRRQIKEAAKAQLDNGVINANDYIREVNAENQALLQKKIHELQLLQAQRNYQIITGKK